MQKKKNFFGDTKSNISYLIYSKGGYLLSVTGNKHFHPTLANNAETFGRLGRRNVITSHLVCPIFGWQIQIPLLSTIYGINGIAVGCIYVTSQRVT
jgi:hypothetical protein